MRLWWVNHNQTARQEIEGQYLWSPKTESHGGRSEFYANMRRATPGDLVLSYAGQMVQYVGRVTDFAMTAPKPEEFGAVGSNWSHTGWLLPVFWVRLARPVSPRALLDRIRPYLPSRYSPINPATGYGNQKAYLAEIPEEVFAVVVSASDYDRAQLLYGGANSLTFETIGDALDEAVERQVVSDLSLDETTRERVIQARRGQGQFRSSVEQVEPACRLTGVSNPTLLIASHIKPWRACETAQERLDGMNGLMLSPDADYLFDRGLVSFNDSGAPLVSSRLAAVDARRLGLGWLFGEEWDVTFETPGFSERPVTRMSAPFQPAQRSYLGYHREAVFLG